MQLFKVKGREYILHITWNEFYWYLQIIPHNKELITKNVYIEIYVIPWYRLDESPSMLEYVDNNVCIVSSCTVNGHSLINTYYTAIESRPKLA